MKDHRSVSEMSCYEISPHLVRNMFKLVHEDLKMNKYFQLSQEQ